MSSRAGKGRRQPNRGRSATRGVDTRSARPPDERTIINERRLAERGTVCEAPDARVVLAYPSPYRAGMSSLGLQTLYRQLNAAGRACHRVFLPDLWEAQSLAWPAPRRSVLSYEALRPLSDYPVIALSVAYELEVTGLIRLLEGSGIPLRPWQRGPRDPIIIAGGPLTNSNASALLPFVDLLICGEGEELLPRALDLIDGASSRAQGIESCTQLPHTIPGELEPGVFEELPGELAVADRQYLPAHSAIVTPHTELADMFLVEPERGCSRRCTFCVMRGETTGGMRLLKRSVPLGLVPEYAKKVGLVGAAVTDHPELEALVADVVESGRGIGISSLRADRLTPQLLANLARGGYRTITVASDGISERMRLELDRKITEQNLIDAAKAIAQAKFHRMKIYQMIGAPSETDEDARELIRFISELAKITRIALTISTFVAKRNTPLDGQPFIGTKPASARLAMIRAGLHRSIEMRPQPPKWAEIEWEVARRGPEAGVAAIEAVHGGGGFRAWQQAFAALGPPTRSLRFGNEARVAQRSGHASKLSLLRADRLSLRRSP